MVKKVRAVYDHGVLRLLEQVDLPEQREVTVVIIEDGVSGGELRELAAAGGAFDFLSAPQEDVYSREDGEPV